MKAPRRAQRYPQGIAYATPFSVAGKTLLGYRAFLHSQNGGSMHTTNQLLDAIKARHGITSEYRLTRTIGITDNTLRNYRHGATVPDDAVAVKLAEMLELDPGYVVACVHAERAKEPQLRKVWEGIAIQIERALEVSKRAAHALVFAIFAMLFSGGPDGGALAATPQNAEHSLTCSDLLNCTLSRLRRLARSLLARCFSAWDAFPGMPIARAC